MMASTIAQVAAATAILGPLSHVLVWMRVNLDTSSHKLLVLANLAVVLPPIAMWLRGVDLFYALAISVTADICYTTTLLASIATYRAFFHALHDFPGPFWARVSVFWKIRAFSRSNYQAYRVIDDLHRQYGPVVRIAPRQLSIADPAAYQSIYGMGSECRRNRHLEFVRKNLQSLADPAEHHARRKLWDHGLNAKACQSYLPRINEITNRLCERFASFEGRPVIVNDWCHFYTFDIMGEIGFGRSYRQIENGEAHPAILKVQNFLKAGVIALQILWAVNFLMLIPGLDDPMRELKEWAEALLAERDLARKEGKSRSEEEKTQEKSESRDLMSYVEESRQVVDKRWPMSNKDIAEDAVTLQVAGSDTSYSVLSNACHYLANYPLLQDRIRKEVKATFELDGGSASPVWSKLASSQNCPWLDATVHEVLRKHAPVPMGTLRETPHHPIEVAGHIIPANTIVSCPIWTLQYDSQCFRQPDKFIPERWLDRNHPNSCWPMLVDKRGFVPFSVGPMNCAGKYFAFMEVKVCLAKILSRFEIVFPEGKVLQGRNDDYQAVLARDQKLVDSTKDYLTQWAGDVEVCFLSLDGQSDVKP